MARLFGAAIVLANQSNGASFPCIEQLLALTKPLQRPIWPGLYTSKIDNSEASWQSEEILGKSM